MHAWEKQTNGYQRHMTIPLTEISDTMCIVILCERKFWHGFGMTMWCVSAVHWLMCGSNTHTAHTRRMRSTNKPNQQKCKSPIANIRSDMRSDKYDQTYTCANRNGLHTAPSAFDTVLYNSNFLFRVKCLVVLQCSVSHTRITLFVCAKISVVSVSQRLPWCSSLLESAT